MDITLITAYLKAPASSCPSGRPSKRRFLGAFLWVLVPSVASPAELEGRPAVAVMFDESSAHLPQPEIRSAIEKELGRPVRDAFDPAVGLITVQVEQGQLIVRYRPPAGELERALPVPREAEQLAQLIALVSHSLVFRDAGITVPERPAGHLQGPPSKPVPELGTPQDKSARVQTAEGEAPAKRVAQPKTRGPSVGISLRGGLFGEVITSGTTQAGAAEGASDGAAVGRAEGSLGVNLRLEVPVIGRFGLATEVGIVGLSSGPLQDDNGEGERLQSVAVLHISTGPSFRLTRPSANTALQLNGAVGLAIPRAMKEDGDRYNGEAGYRFAGSLAVKHRLTERWAFRAAFGVEHFFLAATRAVIEPVQDPAGAEDGQEVHREFKKAWWVQPTLEAGVEFSF